MYIILTKVYIWDIEEMNNSWARCGDNWRQLKMIWVMSQITGSLWSVQNRYV